MQTPGKPSEIEKLGPRFKDIASRSLVSVAVAATLVAAVSPIYEYHSAEKIETAQLIKDYNDADQLTAKIIKESGNQMATDFFILKTALQEEKSLIDEAIKDASALGKMLGLQENRESRSSQYQYMIDDVQHRISDLESKGLKPFDRMAARRVAAGENGANHDQGVEPTAPTL